jgi:transcriptional regulator with GAF, ATPase, and Fis domain
MTTHLIGESPNIKKIIEIINQVADSGLNVVIHGETGVGKEVVAKKLYEESPRFDKPFIKVNCAAVPDGLLESELYGHERGAFTGAERKKRGKFELAHEGVLFLDEIGDMSLNLQAKLLHALQSGEFAPLGSEMDVKADTWVIAATNQDLDAAVKAKTFREDLYYRLNTVKIYIEPLRNRREDIPLLIDYYTDQYNKQYKNSQAFSQMSGKILKRLGGYTWPGNVRELQNVLKRIVVLGNCDEIIDELIRKNQSETGPAPIKTQLRERSFIAELLEQEDENDEAQRSFSFKQIKKRAINEVEKEVISYILNKTNWNRSQAAKVLKISYKTLLNKIDELGIESVPEEDDP